MSLFNRTLIQIPALYFEDFNQYLRSDSETPMGHPVTGGQALFYYGQTVKVFSFEFPAFMILILLTTGILSLGALFIIRKYWK